MKIGDIINYKGNEYFVTDKSPRTLSVRKIIPKTKQVGFNITKIKIKDLK